MSIDELANEMLSQVNVELSTLSPKQLLLYGYVAAMRGLPRYVKFSHHNPEFGNAELALNIASEIRSIVLGQNASPTLIDSIKLLDKSYIPDMDDFGSECAAMEAALALIFLYKYSEDTETNHVFEIFRGIIECILMIDDADRVLEKLNTEQSIRLQQLDLIRENDNVSDELLQRCLAIN
jgi:hypothetical protein